ncbi:ABC transporter permease subunit [Paenibacillus oryzisoli]|uniref:ABC transporter permease n=1 Tax=Paenibacillus oryzisoli TaxID=1850517 RepID=UPI003D2C170E
MDSLEQAIPGIMSSGALRVKKRRRQDRWLFLLFLPALIYFVVFKYVPMGGLVLAFKDYNLHDGILHSRWIGMDNFQLLFRNPDMLKVVRNTLVISMLTVVVGFPFPIIIAILLNEMRAQLFKRTIQTFLYLPHFLNWVIVGSFVVLLMAQEHGMVNNLLERLTGHTYAFLYKEGSWLAVFLGSHIWKEAGYGSIIYLAALSSIDTSLYESASLDGANKWQQIWHITLPGIMPVIVLMMILSLEHVMDVGFDAIYVLGNASVRDIADVISTWSYAIGLGQAKYSLTTALGFFQSLVGLILVLSANTIARKFNHGLW